MGACNVAASSAQDASRFSAGRSSCCCWYTCSSHCGFTVAAATAAPAAAVSASLHCAGLLCRMHASLVPLMQATSQQWNSTQGLWTPFSAMFSIVRTLLCIAAHSRWCLQHCSTLHSMLTHSCCSSCTAADSCCQLHQRQQQVQVLQTVAAAAAAAASARTMPTSARR